jgi:hypothetical protein
MRNVSRNVTLRMAAASLEAKAKLDRQRIGVPTRPAVDEPELPDDPTDLTDSELMRLFTRTTKWSEFLGTQLAVAEVDERCAEAILDKAKVLSGLDFRTTKGRESVRVDHEYWTLQDEYLEANAYRKLIKVKFDNAERNSAMLSRELTRRVNRDSREGRVERYSA